MLLPDNMHPEQSIYFNGAFVLQVLQKNPVCDLLELFTQTRMVREMTMPVFVLCLDWLYLLGLAKMDEQGSVVLCT